MTRHYQCWLVSFYVMDVWRRWRVGLSLGAVLQLQYLALPPLTLRLFPLSPLALQPSGLALRLLLLVHVGCQPGLCVGVGACVYVEGVGHLFVSTYFSMGFASGFGAGDECAC